MNIVLDLDGVICEEKSTFERSLAKPIVGAIESIHVLKQQGHRIFIYTARSWSEYNMTVAWLDKYGISYDELLMGKPIADLWVDDRCLRFSSWAQINSFIGVGNDSDFGLHLLRAATKKFMEELWDRTDIQGPVLEIGPTDPNSNVFKKMPETYIDVGEIIRKKELEYTTGDIAPGPGVDHVIDITDLKSSFAAKTFGTIICNSVLEHVVAPWKVSKQLSHILKCNGKVLMVSPYAVRLHGPRPDCWRISDDGFQALFGEEFNITRMEKVGKESLNPAAFIVEMSKR
jgi:SAM-dependent methyltransferase